MWRIMQRRFTIFAAIASVALTALTACSGGGTAGAPPLATSASSTNASNSSASHAAATTHVVRTQSTGTGVGYWHTSGATIVDANGTPVRIAGVNWFGFETSTFVPHGLWTRSYTSMLDQIKSLGFNAIRMPYLDAALRPGHDAELDRLQSQPGSAGFERLADHGQDRRLRRFDRLAHHPRPAHAAGEPAIGVVVFDAISRVALDLGSADAGDALCGQSDRRRRRSAQRAALPACWGCGNVADDWRLAAERAGNAILAVNPNWLIFVEGNDNFNNDYYWWGGELEGAQQYPVQLNLPNHLVYSAHDYPSSVSYQSWFSAPNYPANLPGVWDAHWGYLSKNGIAPVWLGEFGSLLQTTSDQQWFSAIVQYLASSGISWTFWSWNPDSGDTGGILQNDWQTVNTQKVTALQPIMSPITGTVTPLPTVAPTVAPTAPPTVPPTTPPTPVPTAKPTVAPTAPPTAQPTASPTAPPTLAPTASPVPTPLPTGGGTVACTVNYRITSDWGSGFVTNIVVTNTSTSSLNGWTLAWTFAGNQQITNLWNGVVSQSGKNVSVRNASYNGSLPPGQSAYPGFQGTYAGADAAPTAFTLNGVPCRPT